MTTIHYLINDTEYQYETSLVRDDEISDEIMELHGITEENNNNQYCITWTRA
jgi:DNA polymerase III epsilon subunit-like protein